MLVCAVLPHPQFSPTSGWPGQTINQTINRGGFVFYYPIRLLVVTTDTLHFACNFSLFFFLQVLSTGPDETRRTHMMTEAEPGMLVNLFLILSFLFSSSLHRRCAPLLVTPDLVGWASLHGDDRPPASQWRRWIPPPGWVSPRQVGD